MEEKELYEKLIREQDIVCYYTVKNSDKSVYLFGNYIDNPKIRYLNLAEFILSHKEVYEKFSTKNLFTLLEKAKDKDKQKEIEQIIMERLENENFFCEDIDTSFFMISMHSHDSSFRRLQNDNKQKINSQILKRYQKTKVADAQEICRKIRFTTDNANFLTYFEQGIFTQEKLDFLKKMLEKNENALRYVNFGIFKDEIFALGNDFIEYISKFPALSTQLVILQNHNPNLFSVLARQIEQYESLPDNYDEIELLITYFTRNCFEIQLDKIEPQDIENLIECAVKNSQSIDEQYEKQDEKIINMAYSKDFQKKFNEELDKRYSDTKELDVKKNIFLNKYYSISIAGAKKLFEEYGSDLDNLDELSQSDRKIFDEIKQILEIETTDQIDDLYNNSTHIFKGIDILSLKKRVARECAKSYTKEMKKLDSKIDKLSDDKNSDQVKYIDFNGKKIKQIKLNGKFDLLVHSTDTRFVREIELNENEDFTKKWLKGEDKKNHIISTTYINQDFLGTAPVEKNGVRYGFTSVKSENIRLMGVTDINTYSMSFAYNAKIKQYMSAKSMPYNSRRVYSEIAVEREGTKPDYVVLFDDDLPEVIQNSYKAAEQFDIPIIYIDKREIEQQQIKNLESLMNQFNETKDTELLKQLLNCYETNISGWLLNRKQDEEDKSHTANIDNSRFKKEFSDIWNKIENTVNGYISSIQSGKIQDAGISELIEVMKIVLRENELYKKCDEVKPITKTQISFDVENVVNNINKAFESLGATDYKVDLKKIPTLEQYNINIKKITQNALKGPNAVTIEDVQAAEDYRQKIMEKSKKQEVQEVPENE